MLSTEEEREIRAELEHYQDRQAGCIEALGIVQHHRGWISDESLEDIARLLDMSPAELDSVATFYNLIFRRPVGRHVILVCDTVSCWVMGYEELLDHLAARFGLHLGETSADGRFTLLPIPCLGACDRAPALMIDDDLHLDVSPAGLDEILARYP